MRLIVTDRVAWSVGQFVILVSLSKTAELIEMPFGCGLGWALEIICYIGIQRC